MQKIKHSELRRKLLRQTIVAGAAIASLGISGTVGAQTQQWPTRPVKIIMVSAAGVTDLLARLFVPRLDLS